MKKSRLRWTVIGLGLLSASWLGAETAAAAEYPERVIRLVVPFAPGGSTDVAARLVAQGMSDRLGQQVIVENKPGGSTIIAADFVSKSPPDGYTLLFATTTTVISNPLMYSKLPYSRDSLSPVSMVTRQPFALTARKDLPVKTVADLVKLAREKPNELTIGNTGNGSAAHIVGELVLAQLGIKMRAIPYRGTAQSLTDILAGVLDLHVEGLSTAVPQAASGAVTVLASTSKTRLPSAPNIPTFAEQDYGKVEIYTTFGILAPAGTPQLIVDKLSDVIVKSMADPALRKRFEDESFLPAGTTPTEYRKIIEEESKVWGDVITPLNIKLD